MEEPRARIEHERPRSGFPNDEPHRVLPLGNRVAIEPDVAARLERRRVVGARRPDLVPLHVLGAEDRVATAEARARVLDGDLRAVHGLRHGGGLARADLRDGSGRQECGDEDRAGESRGVHRGAHPNLASMAARISSSDLPDFLSRAARRACALAGMALARHRLALVAGEQRAVAGHVGAAAVAADAVGDLRHLAHGIEERNECGDVRELLFRGDLGAGDSRAGIGVLRSARAGIPGVRVRQRRRAEERREHAGSGENEGAAGKLRHSAPSNMSEWSNEQEFFRSRIARPSFYDS